MKYAVFEFVEDKSCEIGLTSWISGEDDEMFTNDKWFFNKEIMLEWPNESTRILKRLAKNTPIDLKQLDTTMYPAKVVKFGGKYISYILYI